MAKLTKEQRRIEYDGINNCSCGTEINYVSCKWFKGVANKIHYAVICPNCRDNEYMWRKKPQGAIEAWNNKKE